MTFLLLGLLIFFGVHSVAMVAPHWRDAQRSRLGDGPWKGAYSVGAAAGLGLMIVGFGIARQSPVVLWQPPQGLRHVALLLMLPVFPLLFSAYLPGRLQRAARHPMLLAVKIWATAHLLGNGTLADVLLFGAFLAWAVADRISVGRRVAVAPRQNVPAKGRNDIVAVVAGLLVYALLLAGAHRWLFGVSPLG